MIKKALKILLSIQAKSTCIFIGIYALIMTMLFMIFSYLKIDNFIWMSDSIIYTVRIYFMIMGIVYPLIATRLYVSRGLTRRQFFWAYTGAMGIISFFLFIPILAIQIYYDNISLSSAITHYLQMPLFFLIGWTSIVGFQIGKWYTAILGILSAVAVFIIITTVTIILPIPDLAVLEVILLLLIGMLLIIPFIISQIPLKS